MKKNFVASCTLAAALLAAPAAFAQSVSPSPSTAAERGQLNLDQRAGANQREMELVQTSLLNRFGGMGFAEMRNFRKIGENYAAEVRTVEGVWVNVLIDPTTGAVTVQQ